MHCFQNIYIDTPGDKMKLRAIIQGAKFKYWWTETKSVLITLSTAPPIILHFKWDLANANLYLCCLSAGHETRKYSRQ